MKTSQEQDLLPPDVPDYLLGVGQYIYDITGQACDYSFMCTIVAQTSSAYSNQRLGLDCS
jgi:hypothetical protein